MTALKPNFTSFFNQYFKVSGTPDGKPYVMPFSESKGTDWSPFFNRNVAGSYAPSSLRPVSPLRQVVRISGARSSATYSLVADYADKARQHLLFDNPLGVLSLALFLYRDYGLNITGDGRQELIRIFRDEYRFRATETTEDIAFKRLFRDDSRDFEPKELFIKTTLT